jgi:drug/metabolite transporter (DMT)-like permease
VRIHHKGTKNTKKSAEVFGRFHNLVSKINVLFGGVLMQPKIWLVFVILAGLCWGTYVPLIAYGGKELKNSYAGFLCVGVAYFLIAILFPLGVFWARGFPQFSANGVTFATLAGVAGALGALCVIFATFEFKGDRRFVGPLIFALAPVINTLVSLVWHPLPESAFNFGIKGTPDWKLFVGIVLAGLGAFLVLYSKEAAEQTPPSAPPPSAVSQSHSGGQS